LGRIYEKEVLKLSIVCQHIKKFYDTVVALKDASIEVKKGEIRALLGGNGSGKSTLGKVISGNIYSDAGNVYLDGKDIVFDNPAQAKQAGVVLASQELSLFTNMTVEENIMLCTLPTKASFVNKKSLRNKALEVLQSVGMEPLMGKLISELPPNQQYMVEFAKTLAQNPKILILDEITSPMYSEDVKIVNKMMQKLKAAGTSIIFISHRMNEIYALCDSVTVMKNGVTIATFDVKETSEKQLIKLMTGREINLNSLKQEPVLQEEREHRDVLLEAKQLKVPGFNSCIDIQIRKGDIIGIAGLQGNGQSELIRKLYGLKKPADLVMKNGQTVTINSARSAVKCNFAFISGDREVEGTYQERSVQENVLAVSSLVKRNKNCNPYKILDKYGVKYHSNVKQKITSLSGGNQQKVVVARWLATAPVLLLADDPTKGIDVQSRMDLHTEFKKLADQGSALVMVSSDDDELVNLAALSPNSRIWVMYRGKIIKTLRGKEISRENILRYSFPRTETKKGDSHES
jgi:ABC-type sugar transport system ATPase subunit